jgi:hypothetical protein
MHAADHLRARVEHVHGAKTLLCNHYTNLQPLLHEDNAWKGDHWTEDCAYPTLYVVRTHVIYQVLVLTNY